MMTFKELNDRSDTLEQEGIFSENNLTAAADGDLMSKICGVYKKVRPFLEVVTSLFFIPQKWKTPILTLMAVLDGLCPDVVE